MTVFWKEILVLALAISYTVVWYLIERRIRTITRRHSEKIGNGSNIALYRIYRTQISSVRFIFVLWIVTGT
ncbi:MAG TPA: hypothetical protein PK765_01940 [bacterium]|nr:hypothetical protein [bacterium]